MFFSLCRCLDGKELVFLEVRGNNEFHVIDKLCDDYLAIFHNNFIFTK